MGMQIHNPFRRRPVAAVAAALSAVAMVLVIFLLEHPAIYPLSDEPSPWRRRACMRAAATQRLVFGSHSAGVVNWTFLLKKSEIAYLTLIMATVVLLPLLDLLGHLRPPAAKRAAASATGGTLPDTGKRFQAPASSVALGTAGASETSDPPSPNKPSSVLSRRSWHSSCVALVWPFPRLSPTAAVFVATFVVFELLTIIVPLATLPVSDLMNPMFISPYLQVNPDYVLPEYLAWIYAVGAEAAWPTLYTYAIAILPVSRTTPVLACVGLSYEETMAFHKFAGVLATFWACVHGVFSTFPLLSFGWDWYATAAWSPAYASGHMYEFAGQMAVLTQLVMVFFAARYFRERYYKLFRAMHCLYPVVFFATVCHRFTCFWYSLLGITIIMADVGQRLTNKIYASTARLTPTGGDRTVVLHVRSPFPKGAPAVANLPGRFFYLQVPNVSSLEWHPMSVTNADADGNLTFVIKVFGAWTDALHALASTKAGAPVDVRLEGPYGYDWAEPACERLLMGGAHNSVVFVAGGVGIAPFSAIIARLAETTSRALPSLKVLWSVRDPSVLRMYTPLLQRASALGAHIQVHVTGAAAAMDPSGGADSQELLKRQWQGPLHVHTATQATSAKGDGEHTPGSDSAAESTAAATAPRRHVPWSPRSPYYAWLSSAVILYLACAGSVLGFLASRQVFYTYTDMDYVFPPAANATYVDMVLTNYAALHGGAAPPGGWPSDQKPLAEVQAIRMLVCGAETDLLVSCKPTPGVPTPVGFPYGTPLPCRSIAQAFVWPAVSACVLAWGGALLLAALGGLAFKRARLSELRAEGGGGLHGGGGGDGTHFGAAAGGKLAAESGIAAAGTVQLHTDALDGDDGGAPPLTFTAGRPDTSAFLAAAAAAAASGATAATGAAAAVDCYVCGSAGLLSDASDAFYEVVAPACRGSAFLGLHYSIG